MPGFRAHTTINLTVLAGLVVASLAGGQVAAGLVAVAATSFVVATFLLSPDLDLRHSSPTRNWGPLRWLWRPYQLLFKHRGASHSLLLSSVTRMIYLLVVVVGVFTLAQLLAGAALPTGSQALAVAASPSLAMPPSLRGGLWAAREQLAAGGVGILLSDVTHIVADRLVSALRSLAG